MTDTVCNSISVFQNCSTLSVDSVHQQIKRQTYDYKTCAKITVDYMINDTEGICNKNLNSM